MRPYLLLYCTLATLVLSPVWTEPGRSRWDHHPSSHRRRQMVTMTTTTTPAPPPVTPSAPRRSHHGGSNKSWNHRLGWSVPAERCQIPAEARKVSGGLGQPLDSYYIDYVSDLLVQDKTLLSPIVFEGSMVSRTNTYKNLYFVSFKVFRVLKGKIHKQLQGHLRLLFQTESRRKSYNIKGMNNCPPVPFDVRSGRRYLVFVKNLRTPGRYIAIAKPDLLKRKSLKEVNQMLNCRYCVAKPQLKTPKSKKLSQGSDLKLKCKVTNRAVPPPAVSWYKDGALLTPQTVNIITKKKRSTLIVKHVGPRDAGTYTCQGSNIAGTSSDKTVVTIRDAAVVTNEASTCPIDSYCLNGGKCLYYQSIGELACRCSEGFTGQRCQFKKAMKFQSPGISGCGAYGYDINQLCAAWTEAPEEMTKEQYQEWKLIQQLEMSLKKNTSVPFL